MMKGVIKVSNAIQNKKKQRIRKFISCGFLKPTEDCFQE